MKKIICCISFFILNSSFFTPCNAQSWTLVWHDEFKDSVINPLNWTFDTGTDGGGWGNNELEYYTSRPENVTVKNGNLLIIARKENYGNRQYTSGRIKTLYLQRWTYGRIEARIKLPGKQGLWPGFWMLGENMDEIGFPYCGEIDIMEFVNTDPTLHGTMHWAYNGELADYGGSTVVSSVNEYHIYSVEWDSNSIKWVVDGKQYWEGLIKNNINQTNAFHKPFDILLNLAIGGIWPGNPDETTNFPDTMYVDYVRVYQKVPPPK
jgi:beta-glucanase (GH16 family)